MDNRQGPRVLGGPPRPSPSPYERMRDAIIEGVLAPGSPLVEAQVAEWCGVSRTPVREALTRLEQDGLVERGDRGLVVRHRSPEEILGIYEVRISLEQTAAAFAAQRHTPFDEIRLGKLTRAFEEADSTDGKDLQRHNNELHRAVWVSGHNESLVDLLARLNLHLVRYPATTLVYPGRWEEAIEQHRQLIDAILVRDAKTASEVAKKHFTRARDIRLEVWQQEELT